MDTIDHDHGHDRGLAADLSTLVDRRRALKLIAGVGLVALAAAAGRTRRPSSTSTASGELSHDPRRDVDDNRRGRELRDDPRGDGRPVPRRRLERAERADRERHRAQRHPLELRLGERRSPRACR